VENTKLRVWIPDCYGLSREEQVDPPGWSEITDVFMLMILAAVLKLMPRGPSSLGRRP